MLEPFKSFVMKFSSRHKYSHIWVHKWGTKVTAPTPFNFRTLSLAIVRYNRGQYTNLDINPENWTPIYKIKKISSSNILKIRRL